MEDTELKKRLVQNDAELGNTNRLVTQLQKSIARAENESNRYDKASSLPDPQEFVEASASRKKVDALSSAMRRLSLKCKESVGLKIKVEWALVGKDKIEELLDDILNLVRDLEEFFPAEHELYQTIAKLAVQEAKELSGQSDEVLSLLQQSTDKD